jgi:transporter family-2 protein
MKSTWIILTLLAGSFLPIQAGMNSRLGKALESPVAASFISFVVGAIAVAAYGLITKEHVSWNGLKTAPAWLWLGGALGAFYVTVIIYAFPRIGAPLAFGLVVAGQMIMSILLDQFNLLVTQQHPINVWRILGVLLIIAGVVIIRKN